MTFEEFFKKKRIDLAVLEVAEAALFSEFKTHFEQMGEKSFDHTKKYWFNKLRRQYVLAPEVKTEKVHIANPLAEQTITESLSETVATPPPSPKLGFVPKFKMGNMAKPAVNIEEKKEGVTALPSAGDTPVTPTVENAPSPPSTETNAAKPAYKPRFNMKSIPPKPPEEQA
jgi:hypothetical protein